MLAEGYYRFIKVKFFSDCSDFLAWAARLALLPACAKDDKNCESGLRSTAPSTPKKSSFTRPASVGQSEARCCSTTIPEVALYLLPEHPLLYFQGLSGFALPCLPATSVRYCEAGREWGGSHLCTVRLRSLLGAASAKTDADELCLARLGERYALRASMTILLAAHLLTDTAGWLRPRLELPDTSSSYRCSPRR